MAACTFAVGTADTGNTPNTSGAFTPAVGDLLIGFAVVSASVSTDSTLVSSVGGFTFSKIGQQTFAAGTNVIAAFVSDALVSSASSQTVTWNGISDDGTGSVIFVYRVSGIVRVGTNAIRQSDGDFGASGVTPGIDFPAVCLTGNPTIVCLGNSTNPAGVTPPTNWTENASGDLGFGSPTTGAEIASRDSGFTGQAVDWGSSATAWGTFGIEIDSSAAEATKTPTQGLVQTVGQIPGEHRELKQNIGLGAAAIGGQIPVVAGYVFPAQGLATMGGQIPAEYLERLIAPGVGLSQMLGRSPTALNENAIGPTTGLITTAGQIPLVTGFVFPDVGFVTLEGRQPFVDTGQVGVELTAEPGVGLVTIAGTEPSLAVEYDKPRGHLPKRRSRYYGPEYVEVSVSHQPAIAIAPPVITELVADWKPDGTLTLDTSLTEFQLAQAEAERARIARMRREEEELIAILMRAA